VRLHRLHASRRDAPSRVTGHRITGSSVRRVKRTMTRRTVRLTIITVQCSCGESVTGEADRISLAESKADAAYKKHKRGW
jgi:hypothetical protein